MSELISGEEALIALTNGWEVEYLEDDNKWHLIDKETVVISALIDCKIRLNPRTINLNGIEVPAPFLPEEGELFYHASPEYEKGYSKSMAHERNETTWQQFGAWRTEEEIMQVVAALRSVFGKK